MRLLVHSLLIVGMMGFAPACSDGACDRIVAACHDKDTGSGPIHDCHELAESSSEAV